MKTTKAQETPLMPNSTMKQFNEIYQRVDAYHAKHPEIMEAMRAELDEACAIKDAQQELMKNSTNLN